jgi:hypothetical protein
MIVRALVACVALLSASVSLAQNPGRLEMPEFSHLQSKAVESVDITIGPFLMWLAGSIAPERAEDGTPLKEIVKGIEAVYVRSYQFDADNVYSMDDVEKVRSQLRSEQWKPLAEIRSRKNGENVDIFISMENDKPTGFAIVASKPREFTIVNIVGTIDIEHLARLQAGLGLPGADDKVAALND